MTKIDMKFLGRLLYKWFQIEVRYRGNQHRDNKWLIDKKIATIIDVGANEGQFAAKMRRLFPNAQIFSFEPLPHVFNRLKDNFSKDDRFTAFNCALGENNEQSTINLNVNDASSSLLSMSGHSFHFGSNTELNKVDIEIKRMDDIAELNIVSPVLVKLDVQGFEDKVINGGENVLAKAAVIIIEVSFIQLYDNQKLFHDIYTRIYDLGFRYKGNYEQLYSPVNNEILQADAVFIKEEN